ncbi:MAG: GNAT family N-acetyltransferase [Pseudomonadota bacterium]
MKPTSTVSRTISHTVRLAEPDDIPGINTVIENAGTFESIGDRDSCPVWPPLSLDNVDLNRMTILVSATHVGDIIAVAMGDTPDQTTHSVEQFNLAGLFVREAMQQQGLGSALLDSMIRLSRILGARNIAVKATPNSASFFFKHAFRSYDSDTSGAGTILLTRSTTDICTAAA